MTKLVRLSEKQSDVKKKSKLLQLLDAISNSFKLGGKNFGVNGCFKFIRTNFVILDGKITTDT